MFLFQYPSAPAYLNDTGTKVCSSLFNLAICHPFVFAKRFRRRVIWAEPKAFVVRKTVGCGLVSIGSCEQLWLEIAIPVSSNIWCALVT
jgi:hypothetical protein